jgi:hypothetical protein
MLEFDQPSGIPHRGSFGVVVEKKGRLPGGALFFDPARVGFLGAFAIREEWTSAMPW